MCSLSRDKRRELSWEDFLFLQICRHYYQQPFHLHHQHHKYHKHIQHLNKININHHHHHHIDNIIKHTAIAYIRIIKQTIITQAIVCLRNTV